MFLYYGQKTVGIKEIKCRYFEIPGTFKSWQ